MVHGHFGHFGHFIMKTYDDTITADERVDICLHPSTQGEAIVVTDKRVVII